MPELVDLDYLRQIGALIKLQGREYLTHPGLLRVAHENGLKSITCDLISWDQERQAAVVRCQVEGERGTYTSYGDASPANVGRQVATACLRMAETRAINRALRLYTGLGMTTTEELPGGGEEEPRRKESPEEKAARQDGHDPSWAEDQRAFCAELKPTGIDYDLLCRYLASQQRPRPSALTRAQRADLLAWLKRVGAPKIGDWQKIADEVNP